METLVKWILELDWIFVVIACLTLGLAPFTPPHMFEKINMLIHGELKKAIDWFDLLFHATPWIVLILKLVFTFSSQKAG